MASEGRTPLLKKSRWLPLEREENLLKTEQRFQLRDLLRYTRFGLCPIAGCALSQIRRIPPRLHRARESGNRPSTIGAQQSGGSRLKLQVTPSESVPAENGSE